MDMLIPQVSSGNTASVQASKSTTAKTSKSNDFQDTLSSQMKGNSSTSKTDDSNKSAVVEQPDALTSVDESEVIGTEETIDLMALVSGLIDQLDEDEGLSEDSESSLKELEAMLDQLNALLTLLGVPVLKLQQATPVEPSVDNALLAEQQIDAVKTGIQDSLIQLQSSMQEGTLKLVQQQEPTQLIGQQLQAIQQLLQKQKEPGLNASSATLDQSNASTEFVPAPVVATPATDLLQRLSQQVIHPSLLKAQVETALTGSSAESEPVITTEEPVVIQTGINFGDVLRSTTQPAAKAVLQPYVLANQFAESMSDMIIQKFDISSLNGVTEAKIQLFPEQLGQVDVRITMQNGLMTAVFHTDTASAKDVLDNQMAQLRLALQAQGLAVDKLEVTQGQVASQLSNGQQGKGASGQSFTNQNKSKTDRISEDGFEMDAIEQSAIQDMGYGRAVNETA